MGRRTEPLARVSRLEHGPAQLATADRCAVTIVRADRVLQRAARVLEATGEPDLSRELRGVRALFHDVAADLRE
jgi:hypothetical protein